MSFSVAGLSIRPPFQLPQWRGHWGSETSMQLLIGRKIPQHNIFVEHPGWLYPKCMDKQKMEKRRNQWQPMAVFIYICNTAADPTSKLLRLNLVGLIHEQTKCVLYWKMESTKTENKNCSWFQSCMDSIQKQFYSPGRQNQLSGRFCSGYHIYRSVISQFGFPTSEIKPFYFKDMKMGKIGFHSRTDTNHSDPFYDTCGGGTYVEAAFFAIGFSSEQLVCNAPGQLRMINSIPIGYSLCWARKGHKFVSNHNIPHLTHHAVHFLKWHYHNECHYHPSWDYSEQKECIIQKWTCTCQWCQDRVSGIDWEGMQDASNYAI